MKQNGFTFFKILFFIFSTTPCFATEPQDIEIIRAQIIATLKHKNSQALTVFHSFSQRYEKVVFNFFDTHNAMSFNNHLHILDENLLLLARTIKDPLFVSVKTTLSDLYPHLRELLNVLKTYQNSTNYVSLAFAVRKFKFLLPHSVKKRGDLALLWAIRHRLLA